MDYDQSKGTNQKWNIKDGFGTDKNSFNYALESDGSVFESRDSLFMPVNGGKNANIKGEWIRSFKSSDNTGDIDIKAGKKLRVLVKMQSFGVEAVEVKD